MKKDNKGITLIALVITIIVLLILVGVTLAMISGDSSIFTKAQSASMETTASQARELSGLIISELITDWYDGKYVSNDAAIKDSATAGDYVIANLEATVNVKGQGIIKVSRNEGVDTYTADAYPLKINAKNLLENELVGYVAAADGKVFWVGSLAEKWTF